MRRIIGAALSFVLATGAVACSDGGPSAPDDSRLNAPPGMLVSNALASPSGVSAVGEHSALAVSAGSVAFVSAVPGTFPKGVSVTIRNETSHGASQSVALIAGGFDPVAVDAASGDELSLTVFATTGALTPLMIKVPPRRPPGVVRTSPARGRTDVALNVQVVVVFTEPVEPSSVTSSSFALRRGGNVLSGKVQVAADGLSAEFIPDSPLLPQTTYELAIGGAIRDLDGDAMGNEFIASFETGTALSPIESLCSATTACVAFARGGEVFTTALDETPRVLLLENATRPAWSADGSMIAFVRPNEYKLEKWHVCISERDGTRVRCAASEEDGIVVGGPSWSPDGKYVAFSVFVYSCPNGQCGQLGGHFSSVLLLDTSTMQVISVGTQPVTSVAWSPDGRRIAFAAFGTGSFGRGALYAMDPDGSNTEFLGQSLAPYSVVGIAWSPDGARLALALNDESRCPWYCDTALGVVNADGTGLKVLANAHTSFPGQASDRYIDFPAWSTDGRLTYTVIGDCYESEADCPTEIRVWDASRGDSRVLVPNAASGSWRP